MKITNSRPLVLAIAVTLTLNGCAGSSLRADPHQVGAAIAYASVEAPRLPAAGESYPGSDGFDTELTIERAVQAALLNNPQVRAELARLDIAQVEQVQAGLVRNPMVSLMALRPEGGGRFELDYGLMQSLFDLLTRPLRREVASAARQRVEAEVIAALLMLTQTTERAYYELVTAESRLQVRREQSALAADTRRLLQAQVDQGAYSADLVLAQQAIEAMRLRDLHAAESDVAAARAGLAAQLGLVSAAAIRLPAAAPGTAIAGLDLAAAQARAAQHRPELLAADAGLRQAQAEQRLAGGALRNTELAAGPAGTRSADGMRMAGIGIELSLPVFDRGQARRALANIAVQQASYAAEAVRRQVPREVEHAVSGLIAAQQAFTQAQQALQVQQQRESLAQRVYRQGAIDRQAYQQARSELLDSKLEQIDARQALWSARVELERAIGAAVTK